MKTHQDKKELKGILDKMNVMYSKASNKTIREVLECFLKEGIIKRDVAEDFFSQKYATMQMVPVKEFVELRRGLECHEVSAQHGVKREGHDQVFFIAEDCSSLSVGMYEFFEIRTKITVEFQSLQKFYYEYKQEIENVKSKLPQEALKTAKEYKKVYSDVKNIQEK